MRAEVIERLMCDLSVAPGAIAARHGFSDDVFADMPARLGPLAAAGIATLADGRVTVPATHRLFLRNVAAAFDTHFVAAPNRHAKAV